MGLLNCTLQFIIPLLIMIYVYVHMTCVLKRKDNSLAPLQVNVQQEQGKVKVFLNFPFPVVYKMKLASISTTTTLLQQHRKWNRIKFIKNEKHWNKITNVLINSASACHVIMFQAVVWDWPLSIYTYNGCQNYFPKDICKILQS